MECSTDFLSVVCPLLQGGVGPLVESLFERLARKLFLEGADFCNRVDELLQPFDASLFQRIFPGTDACTRTVAGISDLAQARLRKRTETDLTDPAACSIAQ
ncbi:hypothetical protein WS90_06455 [Burkholderia cepacia]|uniref:Uncharacterized protein n=1 Tax=Burkholderia cepacia TaxID=292 RepID=A0A103ZTY9_BURCE|nr:hypothetical protein WS90_06455 [Burkholderia cepacia]